MGFFHMITYGKKIDDSDSFCFPDYLLKLLLIVVFPPFAVWLDQHEKDYPQISSIFICFILTSLFYFPGLLYAFSVIQL